MYVCMYAVWMITIRQCSDKRQNNLSLVWYLKIWYDKCYYIFIALQTVVGHVLHIGIAL